MEKIDLRKYYIEEHIYTGDYYDPNFIVSVAESELSQRLIDLSRNGYKVGSFQKIDHTKREVPPPTFGEQYKVNFHFLIALPKDFKVDNAKTKLFLIKLLNKRGFKDELEFSRKIFFGKEKYHKEVKNAVYDFVVAGLKPKDKAVFQKLKKERGITERQFKMQLAIEFSTDYLKEKYRIPKEYNFIIQSLIEHGSDYTIEFIDKLVQNNISYLQNFNCIPYYINDPAKVKNEIHCRFIDRPEQKKVKKALPIIYYFKNKFSKKTITLPDVTYDLYYKIHMLTNKVPKLTDKQIAEYIFGRCGKKEVDKIKQSKRRLKTILDESEI